jgi:YD repeat-containing protein
LDFQYDYEILTYSGDTTDLKNLRQTDYYDKNGKLIRQTENDGCMRYIYGPNGHLTEKIWGRNCKYGVRELMIYDSNYNLLGTYRTRDSLVNLDTVKYKQTRFYNANNDLIKKLSYAWNDSQGEKHELWNSYVYENNKIITELEIQDSSGLIWKGTYEYDSLNNLIAIKKSRKRIFKTQTFKYDKSGRLIEEEIKSNEYPLTPDVGFSASNNKTLYKYSDSGQLLEEKTLNHLGRVDSKTYYVKKRRL